MYKNDVIVYVLEKLGKEKASQQEIADWIGISQPAFWRWGKKTNGLIPKEGARDLAEKTNGVLGYDRALYDKAA